MTDPTLADLAVASWKHAVEAAAHSDSCTTITPAALAGLHLELAGRDVATARARCAAALERLELIARETTAASESFRVGDRVRVVNGISVGCEGVILAREELAEIGVRIWRVDLGLRDRCVRGDWLELVSREEENPCL